MLTKEFNSIIQLIQAFPTEQSCIDYLEDIRWRGVVESPFDITSKVYKCKGCKYRCKNTGKYFNVKTGTMYENTKIPLQKWFLATWLITSHKKGISSTQLAKDILVTQKTSWFMLQRIRACFGIENYNELDGVVEADETFIGGKNKNRHKDKKVKNSQGRSFKDKVPVMGVLQRGEFEIIERPHKIIPNKTVKEKVVHKSSRITALVVSNTQRKTIQPLIFQYVKKGSRFMSDEWSAYKDLGNHYHHRIIDHSKKEYVNLDDNTIHTNNIEGSWNILKKSVRGMYNHVSKKHLQKYVDEFVFRYNMKSESELTKFSHLMENCDVRTRYKELVA